MDAGAAQRTARIAGLLYLVIMVAAMFAEAVVRGGLIVSGDAAATAGKILGSQQLFRLGGGADVLTFVCDVALSALLYRLLRPVNVTVSVLAAAFRLAYSAMAATLAVALFAPLAILAGQGLAAIPPAELQALSLLMLKLHTIGFNIALVFFGVHIVLLGWLVARARFLPAVIGWLLALAGVCYLVNSGLNLLYPQLSLYPWILLPGLIGEGALTLWLLIAGVNATKWAEVAGEG